MRHVFDLPTTVIIITVAAVGRHGQFEASHASRVLCVSRQPFLDAARALIAEGCPPSARLLMRHQGASDTALRAKLGVAARTTVDEDGGGTGRPKFRRWRAPQTMDTAPPVRFSERAATRAVHRPQHRAGHQRRRLAVRP